MDSYTHVNKKYLIFAIALKGFTSVSRLIINYQLMKHFIHIEAIRRQITRFVYAAVDLGKPRVALNS